VKSGESAAPVRGSFGRRTVHTVLSNGIVLDIVENHAVPTVAIQGAILAGDALCPHDKPALAHLTALMIERGTEHRSKQQIAALLDAAGATRSYEANTYETAITGALLSRDLHLVLEILADELQHPAFDTTELTKAKAEMKSNVLRGAESTSGRAIERLTQLVLPDDHPYRAPGSEKMLSSIDQISAKDLRGFYTSYYHGASLLLAIVGDVDGKATVSLVDSLFKKLQAGTRPTLSFRRIEPGKPSREVVSMPGKANMNLVFGHASDLRRGDPDFEAALIANAAVGQNALASRIGKRVRDTEGLSYNLYSRFWMADYLDGVWFVNVAVAPVNLVKALHSTREEFEKYCREGITNEELETQKNFFAGNYTVNLGSNAGVAAALITAERFGYGPSYLDEYPDRLRKVTREQVNEAIRKHLHPEKLHLVVAGDLVKLPE
jgi:zinc protease